MEKMKNKRGWIIGGLILLALFGVGRMVFGDPFLRRNNRLLKETLAEITTETVILDDVVPFSWDTLFTFEPYTSKDVIAKAIGSNDPAIQESVSEGMTHIMFLDSGKVVASVCAYPENVGYRISFYGGKNTTYPYSEGAYSRLNYGDGVVFSVTQKENYIDFYSIIEK